MTPSNNMQTETQKHTGAARLAAWFAKQCDGEWEHGDGIAIETTDNPGWSVTIDLGGTPQAERSERGNRGGLSWEFTFGQLWGYDEGTGNLEGLLTLMADLLEA